MAARAFSQYRPFQASSPLAGNASANASNPCPEATRQVIPLTPVTVIVQLPV